MPGIENSGLIMAINSTLSPDKSQARPTGLTSYGFVVSARYACAISGHSLQL